MSVMCECDQITLTLQMIFQHLQIDRLIIHHENMSYFMTDGLGFYLQDAYVQDWVDNSMIFLEVEDVGRYWKELWALDLPSKYKTVKLTPIREFDWGRECYMHDPSGILWHIGEFNNKSN